MKNVTKKSRFKQFLAENWLPLVNFASWGVVYSLTAQVGIEALSGLLIFTIVSKTIYDSFRGR